MLIAICIVTFKRLCFDYGSAAFAVMWGLGALLGSLSGAWAMSFFGAHGLPVHLAVVYFIFIAGMLVRGKSLADKRESNRAS